MIRLFDTLAHAKRLIAAGMPPEQAEAYTYATAEALSTALATKADIVTLEGKIAELRLDLRREIAENRSELFKWIIGVGATVVLSLVGLLMTMLLKFVPAGHP